VLDNDLQGNAKKMGDRFRAGLDDIAASTPWIAEVRGKGLMQGFETVQPGTDEADATRTVQVHQAAKDHGVLLGKGGLYGNVIRMSPMLNVTAEEIDEGLAAIRTACAQIN